MANSQTANTNTSAAAAPRARVQVKHPYLTLMGLYLGGFTGMYSETALNIALPSLSKTFGVDTSVTQWLVIGYMLVIGIVLPFAGMLMRRFKMKSLTVFALCAFIIGAIISGLAPDFAVALTGRAIQGIGTGLVLPMMFALVMEVMPPQKMGAAMGITALVIMFAPAVGPTLAGILLGAIGWQAIFFSFAVILVVGLVFTFIFMVNPYEPTKQPFDIVSAILSVLGFGGIVLGAGMASLFGWFSVPVIAAFIIGVIGLVFYSLRQLRDKNPILNLHAFEIPAFRVGAILIMVNFGITLSVMYILPQYFQNGMGIAVAMTGVVMLPGGIVNALVSMVAGQLYDKIGAHIPATVGFGLPIIGAAMLLAVSPTTSLAYVIVCHIILMVGVPLAMSPSQTYALNSLPHRLSADGSTILNTLQQVLGAVCTAVATSLLINGESSYTNGGGTSTKMAFSTGSQWGFTFALCLAIFGFIVTFFMKKPQTAQRSKEAAPATSAAVSTTAQTSAEIAPALSSLMKTDVYTISESASAMDAMRLFSEKGISGAPVVNAAGAVTGFVSDGDVLSMLADQNPQFSSFYNAVIEHNGEAFSERVREAMETSVGEIATKNVITVDADDSMTHICQVLVQNHLKKVPVMSDGKMVGILNRSNILHYVVGQY